MTKKKKANRQRIGESTWVLSVSIGITLILGILIIVFYSQMRSYEEGVLDIYATQQDSYVQLVLDQINLKQNRQDEEIISDILGTLDASANKYWTFSKDQSMLYIKNVSETNKYKGLSMASYYGASSSAADFLNQLMVNRITHAKIELDENHYVASGVAFEYNGNTYRLCLLTDEKIILNNNVFLSTKTGIYTIFAILVLFLFICFLYMVNKFYRIWNEGKQKDKKIEQLNQIVYRYNQQILKRELLDIRRNLWSPQMLEEFVTKLREKEAYPFVLMRIQCEDAETEAALIHRAGFLFGKNVLRFAGVNHSMCLLFIGSSQKEAHKEMHYVMTKKMQIAEEMEITEKFDDYELQKLLQVFGEREEYES